MIDLGYVPMAQVGPLMVGWADATTNAVQSMGSYAFACDDDSIVVFGDGYFQHKPSNAFNVYRIDSSGKYTLYQCYVGSQYLHTIIPLSNGAYFVLLSGGNSTMIYTQNLKANNATPIPIYLNNPYIFGPPCSNAIGLPPGRAIFDGTNGLLGVAWYRPFQSADQVYTKLYVIDPATGYIFSVGVSGFLAISPDGTDAFDRTSSTIPAGYTLDGYCYSTSGQYLQILRGLFGQGYSLGQNNILINFGNPQGNCGTAGDPSGTAISTDTYAYFGTPFYQTTPVITTGHACAVDSCLRNTSGIAMQSGAPGSYRIVPIVQSNGAQYRAELQQVDYEGNVVITPRYVWNISSSASATTAYIGTNPGFVTGYGNVNIETHHAANFTRPISILGAFKA